MLKAAVVGVGYLGRFHAQKYRDIDNVEFVGVFDTNYERAKEIALECSCKAYNNIDDLLEKVDLVSVVTPASTHYEISKYILNKGKHCLIEKPFTKMLTEATELMELAKNKNLIIQIGHLERFNTVTSKGYSLLNSPKFIECHRLAQFTSRSTDIDVVFDLMIHDIDLLLGVFNEDIIEIDAVGVPVLTDKIDIAHAKFIFKNGAMANLTASRISNKTVRKMRVFQKFSYVGLDFHKGEIEVFERLGNEGDYKINGKILPMGTTDAIKAEILSFIDCVQNNKTPIVSAYDAYKSLDLSHRVVAKIQERMDAMI